LSYGPAGFGKSTISEVLIAKIVKDRNDIFILGRKTDDVDELKRWLQQRPVISNQKIIKIEEMDRLSQKAQVVLKDGLMEKYQHNAAFLATTNNPEKIDPALLTRFNTKINFSHLPVEGITKRLKHILENEKINYKPEELTSFVEKFKQRGLRDLINNLEIASINGEFTLSKIESFSGISENEDHIIQYITYLVKYVESLPSDKIKEIIKDAKKDQQFYTYYEYIMHIFKNELRLNWHTIYKGLIETDLDMTSKNIINDYWQDLDLKRFKTTHTLSLLHDLVLNALEQRGEI
jgi:DNA polymerase III gamma/tau subunit